MNGNTYADFLVEMLHPPILDCGCIFRKAIYCVFSHAEWTLLLLDNQERAKELAERAR